MLFEKRDIYSDNGWKWLLSACKKTINPYEQAEMVYIATKS